MDRFEEYKFFSESTQRLSERRLAASGTFVAVHTAVFGVLSLAGQWPDTARWTRFAVSLPLLLAGILACLLWHQTLVQYRSLIAWRYDQLIEMERTPEMAGSHRMYSREWEHFYQPGVRREQFGFSRIEIWLPRIFLAIDALYGAGIFLVAVLGI
jgi:hypothetical protein